MRALIWLIGIFALAVGVTMLAGVNDGYVLVVLSPWRAQVSLNLFIVVLVVGVALIHLLLRRGHAHRCNCPAGWRAGANADVATRPTAHCTVR